MGVTPFLVIEIARDKANLFSTINVFSCFLSDFQRLIFFLFARSSLLDCIFISVEETFVAKSTVNTFPGLPQLLEAFVRLRFYVV